MEKRKSFNCFEVSCFNETHNQQDTAMKVLMLWHTLWIIWFADSPKLCRSFLGSSWPVARTTFASNYLEARIQIFSLFASHEHSITESETPISPQKSSREPSERRKRMDQFVATVEKYCGRMAPSDDWKRARNYLYRQSANDTTLTAKQVTSVLQFLSSHLEQDLVCHIVQSTPRILRNSVATRLDPTMQFLKGIYPEAFLPQALQRKPDLLLTRGVGYKADDLNLIQQYLTTDLGMTERQIQKLQNNKGAFLFQLPLHKVMSMVVYFQEILSQIMPEEKTKTVIGKIIATHPQLFQLSLTENLQPRIQHLQSRLLLESHDVAQLLQSSSAGILALNVQDNLDPTIDYLESIIQQGLIRSGHTKNATMLVKECILNHPPILGLSLKDNIMHKVEYFDSIGSSESERTHDLAARILRRAPSIYSLSLEKNLLPTIRFLSRVWGHDQPPTDENVTNLLGSMIGEYPGILTLSLKNNIMPTFGFYNSTGFCHLDSQWNLINSTSTRSDPSMRIRGRYVATSLYNCLLPRWNYLMVECNSNDTTITREDVALYALAGTNDGKFCEQFGLDTEHYRSWKKEAIPRLKFAYEVESWMSPSFQMEGII